MEKQTTKENISPPCRLHAIVAAKAKKAVVFRRGPSKWWHILEWDLENYDLESGAWVKGNLYPRRSAISADGKLLCYFMLKGDRFNTTDSKWNTFFAVSKVPWVTALAAWTTGGTWTTGCWFGNRTELNISGSGIQSFHGKYQGKANLIPIWMEWDKARFFQELKTGWQFIDDKWISENKQYLISALPVDKKIWPKPPMGLMKYRRKDKTMLILLNFGINCARQQDKENHPIEGRTSDYILRYDSGELEHLDSLRWADWDHQGNLITATWDGRLCVYQLQQDDTLKCIKQHDLNNMEPNPVDSPSWAK